MSFSHTDSQGRMAESSKKHQSDDALDTPAASSGFRFRSEPPASSSSSSSSSSAASSSSSRVRSSDAELASLSRQKSYSYIGNKKIRLGFCCMDRKIGMNHCKNILARIDAFGDIQLVRFGDQLMLHEPPEKWPRVDVLIAYYSDGFPLEKVIEYVKHTGVAVINDVQAQQILLSRKRIKQLMLKHGIPTPKFAIVNRDDPKRDWRILEYDDRIEISYRKVCGPASSVSDPSGHGSLTDTPHTSSGSASQSAAAPPAASAYVPSLDGSAAAGVAGGVHSTPQVRRMESEESFKSEASSVSTFGLSKESARSSALVNPPPVMMDDSCIVETPSDTPSTSASPPFLATDAYDSTGNPTASVTSIPGVLPVTDVPFVTVGHKSIPETDVDVSPVSSDGSVQANPVVSLAPPTTSTAIPTTMVTTQRYTGDSGVFRRRGKESKSRLKAAAEAAASKKKIEERQDVFTRVTSEFETIVIRKPFIEKPLDAEDHNIWVYYKGGGSRRLFRKVKDRSSELSERCCIRFRGSYLYEQMLDSEYDIKCYTVGRQYLHTEKRKPPTKDGIVKRDVFNKEVRRKCRPTREEREIGKKIVDVFGQRICGFDILRVKIPRQTSDLSVMAVSASAPSSLAAAATAPAPPPTEYSSMSAIDDLNGSQPESSDDGGTHGIISSSMSSAITVPGSNQIDIGRYISSSTGLGGLSSSDVSSLTVATGAAIDGDSSGDESPRHRYRRRPYQPRKHTGTDHSSVAMNAGNGVDVSSGLVTTTASVTSSAISGGSTGVMNEGSVAGGGGGSSAGGGSASSTSGNYDEESRYKSYVIDVNGFSFCKTNRKFFDDAAYHIRKIVLGMYAARNPHLFDVPRCLPSHLYPVLSESNAVVDSEKMHILRGVIAVFRHGDRTPKQKYKCTTHNEYLCELVNTSPKQSVKWIYSKNRDQIKHFAVIAKKLYSETGKFKWLRMSEIAIQDIMSIKMQFKPFERSQDTGLVTEVLCVVKWGGELTPAGVLQAKDLTGQFRDQMLKCDRLNQRRFLQGLKAYTTEELRVRKSCYLMIRGLLATSDDDSVGDKLDTEDSELAVEDDDFSEGYRGLPKDTIIDNQSAQHMLDDVSPAKELIDLSKRQIQSIVEDKSVRQSQLDPEYLPATPSPPLRSLSDFGRRFKAGTPITTLDLNSGDHHSLSSSSDAVLVGRSALEKHPPHPPPLQSVAEEVSVASILDSASASPDSHGQCKLGLMADQPGPDPTGDEFDALTTNASSSIFPSVPSLIPADATVSTAETMLNRKLTSPATISRRSKAYSGNDSRFCFDFTMSTPNLLSKTMSKKLLPWSQRSLKILGDPMEKLQTLRELLLVLQLKLEENVRFHIEAGEDLEDTRPYLGESRLVMKQRWDKIIEELFNNEDTVDDEMMGDDYGGYYYDCSKIPDVFDSCRYDLLHNRRLLENPNSKYELSLEELWNVTEELAGFVMPQEYGCNRIMKKRVGSLVCKPLFHHFKRCIFDYCLKNDSNVPRCFLYYTSESYLHSLRNVLILSPLPANKYVACDIEGMECSYFSHCVIRVFEDPQCESRDERFYIDISFSPGAHGAPLIEKDDRDVLPVVHACPLTGRFPLRYFLRFCDSL